MMIDNKTTPKIFEDAILDYAAGKLSPARRAIIACQRDISEAVNREISFHETIAAGLMGAEDGVALSPDFFDNIKARISQLDAGDDDTSGAAQGAIADTPLPRILERLCGCSLSEIKWKTIVPGLVISAINGDRKTKKTGECLYLLRGKSGVRIPEHSHVGEEWALILQGAYESGGVQYSAGDIHISNEHDDHGPQVVEGEDCVCLVMTEGPLKMKKFWSRILQPRIGI